jgi:hypothetical protein
MTATMLRLRNISLELKPVWGTDLDCLASHLLPRMSKQGAYQNELEELIESFRFINDLLDNSG